MEGPRRVKTPPTSPSPLGPCPSGRRPPSTRTPSSRSGGPRCRRPSCPSGGPPPPAPEGQAVRHSGAVASSGTTGPRLHPGVRFFWRHSINGSSALSLPSQADRCSGSTNEVRFLWGGGGARPLSCSPGPGPQPLAVGLPLHPGHGDRHADPLPGGAPPAPGTLPVDPCPPYLMKPLRPEGYPRRAGAPPT